MERELGIGTSLTQSLAGRRQSTAAGGGSQQVRSNWENREGQATGSEVSLRDWVALGRILAVSGPCFPQCSEGTVKCLPCRKF